MSCRIQRHQLSLRPQCTCKYSNNPSGTTFNPTPTKKGDSARAVNTSQQPKKRTAGQMMSESEEREKERVDADAATGMRIRRDSTEGRLIRGYELSRTGNAADTANHSGKNELIWVKLPKPFANPTSDDTVLPLVIDRWPAIIVQAELKVHEVPRFTGTDANGDTEITFASALESSARSPLKTTTKHQIRYQTKFCGLVASGRPETETSVGQPYDNFSEGEILPYLTFAAAAETELALLELHAKRLIKQHVELTQHEAGVEAARESFVKRVLKRNKQTLGSLSEPDRWDVLVMHYLLAVQTAQVRRSAPAANAQLILQIAPQSINNSWSQISAYSDPDEEAGRPKGGETVTLQQVSGRGRDFYMRHRLRRDYPRSAGSLVGSRTIMARRAGSSKEDKAECRCC